MKLRAIRLENVRKFAAPVAIEGIGDGLNLVCEGNEFGKSTIVDALHALFFTKHTSWKQKEAARLAPHAGGDPIVAADVEIGGVLYTVEKTFSAKPTRRAARILRGGRIVAQSDAAEEWLRTAVPPPEDGGASQLVWVRQGTAPRIEGAETARRDLLNAVAGEVGAITGAQRLDGVRDALRDELQKYETAKTGKVTGELAEKRKRVIELEAQRIALAARVDALKADLERRTALTARLARLDDPADTAERLQKLAAATDALREAERHAGEFATATAQAQRLAAEEKMAADRLASLEAAIAAASAARAGLAGAAEEEAVAAAARARAEAEAGETAAAHAAAREAHRAAAEILRAAMRQASDAVVAARRGDLAARVGTAEAARAAGERAAASAGAAIAADAFARLAALEAAVEAAERAHALGAPTLTMAYDRPGGGVSVAGRPLAEGEALPVPDGAVVSVAGIGTLTVRPGAGASGAAVAAAREKLAAALSREGFSAMAEARASDRSRLAAEEAGREAAQRQELVAPDGVGRLREALASLPAPAAPRELPPLDVAEAAERTARAAAEEAEPLAETARRRAEAERSRHAAAEAARAGEAKRLAETERALAAYREPAAERRARTADLAAHRIAARAAAEVCEKLAAAAPDLAALKAHRDHRQAVIEEALRERQAIREELSGLAGRIASTAGDAVADELATVEGELVVARARRDAAEAEHAMLRLLDETLARARTAAVERYLAPVLAEVAPLIAAVWPTATLVLDPETALPTALKREFTEDVDILSGGAQEQLALLVRLAFARLLARAGAAWPVILDDAIVFTDDDRIEEIFSALHRVAGETQIIVFSCRARAFRELGGRRLAVEHPSLALAAE